MVPLSVNNQISNQLVTTGSAFPGALEAQRLPLPARVEHAAALLGLVTLLGIKI